MQNTINLTGDLSLIVPSVLTFATVMMTTYYARRAAKESKIAVAKVDEVHVLMNSERTADRRNKLALMLAQLALLNRVRKLNGKPADDQDVTLLEGQIVAMKKEIQEREEAEAAAKVVKANAVKTVS